MMAFVARLLLSLSLIVLVAGRDEQHAKSFYHRSTNEVVSPPLPVVARYDFTRDNCFNETFPNFDNADNQLKLNLYRNNETTSCSHGLGVENRVSSLSSLLSTSRLSSTSYLGTNGETIHDLLQPYRNSKQGITVELWLKPLGSYDDKKLRPILTFGSVRDDDGRNNVVSSNGGLTECDVQELDLQIAQRGLIVEVIYRTSDPIFEPCIRFRLVDLPLWEDRINHVIVSLGTNKQQFFVNGQTSPVLDEQFDGNLDHWNENDEILLFSYARRESIWNGRLYQLIIYNGFLSEALFEPSKLAMAFPPSQPYAISETITMNEDGDLNPGSHELEWFSVEPRYEKDLVPEISLSRGSVEHEVHDFLDTIGITQDPPRSLLTYITRLPSRGVLYQAMDGSKLNNTSGGVIPVAGEGIVFLPVHNEHSNLPGATYASFDYCVTDHEIFEPWECDSSTISIAVNPVNDPPLPLAFPGTITVNEGIPRDVCNTVELTGSDVDSGDIIELIQITMNPKLGHLVLSVSTFREDGFLHGTLISDLNNTIPGPSVFLEYRFDGANEVVQHGKVKDTFRFRVSDKMGSWSKEKTVSIQVDPSVVGRPQPTVNILEDSLGIIELHGVDDSSLRREIGYFIESTPSETEGVLFDTAKTRLRKDSIVGITEAFPYRHGANIIFQPAPDFCTDNSTLASVFSYRVAAFANARVASISSPVVQGLIVECQTDPIYLSGPETIYYIEPFVEARDDPCSGYMFNISEVQPKTCSTAAVITGLQVSTRDTQSIRANVSISATHGLLTLNRNYWDDVTPLEGQEEARRVIRFLAQPNKLNDILSFLHFQSDVPGYDTIRIVIHYGKCNVMGLEPRNTTKNDPGCHVVSHSISVVVMSPSRLSGDSYLFRGFQGAPLPFAMLMLLLIKVKGRAREKLSKNGGEEELHVVETLCDNQVQEIELTEGLFRDKNASEEYTDPTKEKMPDNVTETMEYLWIQYCDDETGHYYYHNVLDGSVTWAAPADASSVRFAE